MSKINEVFQSFRCPNCNTLQQSIHLERNLTTCSKRVKNVYTRNVYQIRETLSAKLDSFGFKYMSEQKFSKNLSIFEFELTCVQEETFRDTNTKTWLGKHVPISVSISSKLVEEQIVLWNTDPYHLVAPFIGAPENIDSQSTGRMKKLFVDIETTLKIKLCSILE